MSQPEQKQGSLKQIRTWLSKHLEGYNLVLMVSFLIAISISALYGREAFVSFVVSWSAGILGIMAGFALDRRREENKDDRVKKDFLALMRNELTEIRGKIPPQNKTPVMLYPEVWDSFVSSGLMRLLSVEQVTKLSSVYRFIKRTQYEAEWVRRVVEEHSGVPDIQRERQDSLLERYKFLQDGYVRHGKQLSEEIEKILGEKWWSS